MRFGLIPLDDAMGAILAHSVHLPGRNLRKGRVIGADDIAELRAVGMTSVVAARPGPDDVPEDEAAGRLGDALLAPDLEATVAFGGRVNLIAVRDGQLRVDVGAVQALNAVDESITLATLHDQTRVTAGRIVATVKIIPYATPRDALAAALSRLSPGVLRLERTVNDTASLILTRLEGFKPALLDKARQVTEARLASLGIRLTECQIVDHDSAAVAGAITQAEGTLVLVLGASATSDRADVVPAGLVLAGGTVTRFGMPVDPGNLLFIGEIQGRRVVGLPGCARAPALNGADWVLQRLSVGQDVDGAAIAAMGVGGLLKEIPQRARPRASSPVTQADRIEIILLAAGASRRMGGTDKLLQRVDDETLIRRSARIASASNAAAVHVTVPADETARAGELADLDVTIVPVTDWREGMAASLRAGLRAVSPEAAAVVIALADMPEVTAQHFNALIAAFDPAKGRAICRAATETGIAGHPVLFARRYFENLGDLQGDRGAREVIALSQDQVFAVETPGLGALVDLDTPRAWADWRAKRDTP